MLRSQYTYHTEKQGDGGRSPMDMPLIKAMNSSRSMNILLFSIQDYYLFRELYGDDLARQLDEELLCSVSKAAQKHFNSAGFKGMMSEPGECILVWPENNSSENSIPDMAYSFKIEARNILRQTMIRMAGREVELGVGFSKFTGRDIPRDKDFIQGVNTARRSAKSGVIVSQLELGTKFNNILLARNIKAVYQPIMDFSTGAIFAWEALARGPKNTNFHSPVMLFELAEQLERLFALEEVCREQAISNLGEISEDQKLFLNIHPKTMADPEFTPGKTQALLERTGLKPENIVFEITEKHSVESFKLFHQALEHYRSQGFQVAVDDAGSGYSGLTTIAELRPDYIKIDRSLVNNVDRDPVKRALLETFVTFAEKIESRIIAEGIETKSQAVALRDIGVHYGQGFYLAKPSSPKPDLKVNLESLRSGVDIPQQPVTCSIPVGNLAESPFAVEGDYLVSDAHTFFENNRQFTSMAVVKNNIPLGIVMEYHLNRQLTTRYGMALYFRRPVANIMDKSPLIVPHNMPVERAAKAAMDRESLKAYEDLLITKKGYLYGVITVQKLMNTLAQVQVEVAKGTNPLTGLPGNVSLEQEIEDRINSGNPFDIVYADLDHFKVYNDTYGFKSGDQVIKLAADILSWAVRRHGNNSNKLCHIGGDDFVILGDNTASERICLGTTRCFKRLIKNYYCTEDKERGWIKAKGRDGVEKQYPLVSISMGILGVDGHTSLKEIGEKAAHVKKYAKSTPGNSYVRDRRNSVNSPEEDEHQKPPQ